MGLKNTSLSYGSIAKWLHWIIAFLFLGAYMSVYYRHYLTVEDTPENWTALQLHLSIGMTIGVFVLLRIIWRLMNDTPSLEPGSRWEHLAAKLGHIALYAIMIVMPLTGYIGTGVNTELFLLTDITKFENTTLFDWLVNNKLGMTFEEFEEPVDFIHKEIGGKWVVWLLILVHFSAAMYHHFVKKDRTLSKMGLERHRKSVIDQRSPHQANDKN